MEFTADKQDCDNRECVAYLTHMDDNPKETCLVIKHGVAAFWLYWDGASQVSDFEPDSRTVTKKFYKGDSVTITF